MKLQKALTYPALTVDFALKLEKRRAVSLAKYRLINDILEKPSKVETQAVHNFLTKTLYKLFGWLVIKDETI